MRSRGGRVLGGVALAVLAGCAHPGGGVSASPPASSASEASPAGGGGETAPSPRPARTWYLRGMVLADRGACEAALQALTSAHLYAPEAAWVRWRFGQRQLACGDAEQARRLLGEAAEAGAPAWPDLLRAWADDPAARRRALEAWSATEERDPAALLRRGELRLAAGDAEGAWEDLAAALPERPEALDPLLDAAAATGRWASTLEAVGRGARRSDRVGPWRVVADLSAELGLEDRHLEALGALDRLGEDIAADLGRSALRTGDRELAEAALGRCGAGCDPVLRARLLVLLGRPDEAEAALAASPAGTAAVLLERSEILAARGEVDRALEVVAGIPGLPAEAVARLEARLLLQAGRDEEAEARLRAVADRPRAARMLARLLAGQGRFDEALAVLGALERPGADERALEAAILEAAGRPEAALAAARAALAADPDQLEALEVAARLLADRDPEEARRLLARGLERAPARPGLVALQGLLGASERPDPEAP